MEQEKVNCRLIQFSETGKRGIDFFAQLVITIIECMVLLRIMKDFLKHGFIGISAISVYLLKVSIGVTLFSKTIQLHIQVIQEVAFKAVF